MERKKEREVEREGGESGIGGERDDEREGGGDRDGERERGRETGIGRRERVEEWWRESEV